MPPLQDLEAPAPKPQWETDRFALSILAEDASSLILEQKHAQRTSPNTPPSPTLTARIRTALTELRAGVGDLEQALSAAEEGGGGGGVGRDELRRWEEAVLGLSGQCDRLEGLARGDDHVARNDGGGSARAALLGAQRSSSSRNVGKAVRFNESGSGGGGQVVGGDGDQDVDDDDDPRGGLQLQQRIMDDQDTQLDELSATIGRQKQIGIMINDELDMHVDMLLETEDHVDSTHRRLAGAGRRLEQVLTASARNSNASTVICVLVGVLVLVIIVARKF